MKIILKVINFHNPFMERGYIFKDIETVIEEFSPE